MPRRGEGPSHLGGGLAKGSSASKAKGGGSGTATGDGSSTTTGRQQRWHGNRQRRRYFSTDRSNISTCAHAARYFSLRMSSLPRTLNLFPF
ncbi:unnamed protein product [Urochloa humidicola]